MRNVFKQPELQQQFDQFGYVAVPFLAPDEVAALQNAYFETLALKGGNITGEEVKTVAVKERITYDFTFIDKNIDYKRKVFDIITAAFKKHTDHYLADYKPIIANFIYKPENDGEVPLHQNWAFVDESQYTSVSVWVPLVDSNEQNGTLQMVNGSHKRFGQIRGPLVPWELDQIKSDIIDHYLTPMNVPAGQAVVLDDSIVHYSDRNLTSQLRLAIQLIMIPREATAIHYHYNTQSGGKEVEVWEVDENFFAEFNPWKIPDEVKVTGKVPFSHEFIDVQQFEERFFMPRYDKVTVPAALPPSMQATYHNPPTAVKLPLPGGFVFLNPQQQQHFEEKGWVVLDLLSDEEVQELLHFYHNQPKQQVPEHGFHVSLDSSDTRFTAAVIDKLTQIMGNNANRFFKDYKLFTGSFVVKEPGKQGIVPPHQDWTFVDETKYFSATLWTPLQDVNTDNGALGVISGSQNYFNHPRPSPAPVFKAPFDAHVFTVFPYLDIIELKAGQALMFNNRTIHASPPNVSGAPRIAAGIGITHKDAQLIHCYLEPGRQQPTVGIYTVNEQFFPVYNNEKLKSMYLSGRSLADDGWEKIAETPLQAPEISAGELTAKITQSGNVFNWALAAKMAALFGYSLPGANSATGTGSNNHTDNNTQPDLQAETWLQVYTPGRIWAELKHKFGRLQQHPEIYTPANVAAELLQRGKQSKVVKAGAVVTATAVLLRVFWPVLRFLWQNRRSSK